jgi:hypothetical protein
MTLKHKCKAALPRQHIVRQVGERSSTAEDMRNGRLTTASSRVSHPLPV